MWHVHSIIAEWIEVMREQPTDHFTAGDTVGKRNRRKSRKWIWIAIGLVVLGGLILLALRRNDPLSQAYFYEPWQTSSRDFQAARSKWNARPFNGYHLTLQYQVSRLEAQPGQIPDYVTNTCEVEVIVADRAEQQIKTVSNSCSGIVPQSVAEVFAMFEERATRPVGKSPPLDQQTGCYREDDGFLDLIKAEYDSESGYPRQIGNTPIPLMLPGNCWVSMLQLPNAAGFVKRYQIIVKELTPLQSPH